MASGIMVNIGSGNGFLAFCNQAITKINADFHQFYPLPLRTNFNEIYIKISHFFSRKDAVCKIATISFKPHCVAQALLSISKRQPSHSVLPAPSTLWHVSTTETDAHQTWILWHGCETCAEMKGHHINRDQSRYVPSQWEMSLHCNNVSHWLGIYLDCSLHQLLDRYKRCWRLPGTFW